MEEIFLPEDGPTELGTNISIADAEWAEQEAGRAAKEITNETRYQVTTSTPLAPPLRPMVHKFYTSSG